MVEILVLVPLILRLANLSPEVLGAVFAFPSVRNVAVVVAREVRPVNVLSPTNDCMVVFTNPLDVRPASAMVVAPSVPDTSPLRARVARLVAVEMPLTEVVSILPVREVERELIMAAMLLLTPLTMVLNVLVVVARELVVGVVLAQVQSQS